MKNCYKVIIGILSMVSLIGVPNMKASAKEIDNNGKIGIENHAVTEGNLYLYLNKGQEPDIDINSGNTTVRVGNQEISIEGIQSFADAQEPSSYLCLVDVSGSLDEKRMETIRSIMRQIADNKKENDNMCIRTIGDNLTDSEFIQDSKELNSMIDSIQVSREDTNLFYGIEESIKKLLSDQNVRNKRCLIIFSDGAEDQAKGITREEAENTVRKSTIPVYTVAMLKEEKSKQEIENAKILGSFARNSLGGVHYVPALEGYSPDEVYQRIMHKIGESIVLQAKLENLTLTKDTVSIEVQVVLPDGTVLKCVREVAAEPIMAAMIQPKEEPSTIVVEPTEPPTEEAVAEGKLIFGLPVLYVYIAAGVLMLIVVLLLILLINASHRKKQRMLMEDQTEEEQPEQVIQPEIKNSQESSVISGYHAATSTGMAGAMAKAMVKATVTVTLVRLGISEGESFQIQLTDNCKIGRDKNKCDFTFSKDSSLSGIHCTLFNKNGQMILRDENSMNGTFVNGIPITGEFELHKDDIVSIGSYEYRICW